ncbi:MAG: hypothetical protein KKC37_14805 [Proteobacteria bacterium]|nr:hypothetical protein [Pseudomonadota bacterium]
MRRLVVALVALLLAATAAQAQVAPLPEGVKDFRLVYMEATATFTLEAAQVTARYQILPGPGLKPGTALQLFFPKRKGYPALKKFSVKYASFPLKGGSDPPLRALPLAWPPAAKWSTVEATARAVKDAKLAKYYDRMYVFTIPGAAAGDSKKRHLVVVSVSYSQALRQRRLIMPFRIVSRWPSRIGKAGIRLKVPKGYWISSSTRSFRRARGGDYLWSFRRRGFKQDLGLRMLKGTEGRRKRRGIRFRWHINL